MKKWWIVLLFNLYSWHSVGANELTVFTWANYFPSSVLSRFERETGIHVTVSEYDSNEMLYAKLKFDDSSGYDIVVPSSYFVPRLVRDHLLLPLDSAKMPNIRYINPFFLHRSYDPKNLYSVPFAWGATGMLINRRVMTHALHHWSQLWDKRYRNQLLLLDDVREVFSVALICLGYSPNDTNRNHIKQAYNKLRALLPNIKVFNTDAMQNLYVDEDVTIGMAWSEDAFAIMKENTALQFVFPDDPFAFWIDCLVIMKHAPHRDNAYRFIDFINRPEIAVEIAIKSPLATPNEMAVKRLPRDIRTNRMLYPSKTVMRRAVLLIDVGEAMGEYMKYWYRLKLGG